MFDPFTGAGDTTSPSSSDSWGSSSDTGSWWDNWGGQLFSQIPGIMKGTQGLITAGKGLPYSSGPYGPSSGMVPYYGSGLAAGGLGISNTTLLLIGGAVLLFMMGRK